MTYNVTTPDWRSPGSTGSTDNPGSPEGPGNSRSPERSESAGKASNKKGSSWAEWDSDWSSDWGSDGDSPDRGTSPSHISPAAVDKRGKDDSNGADSPDSGDSGHRSLVDIIKHAPEGVRYFLTAVSIMLGAELLHQILNLVMVLIDPSELMKSAREANKGSGQDVSEQQITTVAYTTVIIMALLSLVVLIILAMAVKAVARQKGWAGNARVLLMVFSVFFGLRLLTVFVATAVSGSAVPTAVIAIDGIIQISAGVAGICAVIFATQDDVHKWTASDNASGPRGHNNVRSNSERDNDDWGSGDRSNNDPSYTPSDSSINPMR